jgi:hypothetical protein
MPGKKSMITLQYLEDTPDLAERKTSAVIEKLRAAADRLPFSHLLIGWHLPRVMLDACRLEAERLGLRFLRWHPMLTGDAVFQPDTDWQVEGAGGRKIPGYRGMPEFTFLCPNHPEVREEITRRLGNMLEEGLYQGFFLDRVRFPSPASQPVDDLGCFCEHCRCAASDKGLDLERVRSIILDLDESPHGRLSLVRSLLGGEPGDIHPESAALLGAYLRFRDQSMTDFSAMVCEPLRAAGMEIGLNCFSPGLTRMVGQDVGDLGACADWIKLMTYAHTLGPAGIPYELLGFFDNLTGTTRLSPSGILHSMGEALRFSLPEGRAILEESGISSSALESELRRGVQASAIPVLAGLELVEIEGVTRLNTTQIRTDLAAVLRAGVAGLSLSWDLWNIPLERLELVRRLLAGDES